MQSGRSPTAEGPSVESLLNPPGQSSAVDLESGADAVPGTSSLRQRVPAGAGSERPTLARGISRVGSILHAAHAQDFERRKRPETEMDTERGGNLSSDEEGEATESEREEEEEWQDQRTGTLPAAELLLEAEQLDHSNSD